MLGVRANLCRLNWMKLAEHDLILLHFVNGILMSTNKPGLVILGTICSLLLSLPSSAELRDQGLNSIMAIIDSAISQTTAKNTEETDSEAASVARDNANASVVNLSRTLGTLSYSRLQCGEAGVLAEFTQRVQQMPKDSRDAMRDAFQEGFDKSKQESTLLTVDECNRLTESRNRREAIDEQNVIKAPEKKKEKKVEKVEVVPAEDPKLRHLRMAEISGQLAYKRKFCADEKVFNRDFNAFLKSVPEAFLDEVKDSYWAGYKHGKRLNKNLTSDQC